MAEGGLDLGKQVGPLPLGGWLVVVAGGLGIAYFINRGQAGGSTATEQPLVDPGVGTGLVPSGSAFTPGGTEDEQVEQTNQQWGVKALNYLIGQNHNPSTADNAIRKYLVGEDLTLAENALVNLAILSLGAPPDPLPPVTVPTIPDAPPTGPGVVGAPSASWSTPYTIRAGSKVPLNCRVKIGGAPPVSVADRVVKFTVYSRNKSIYATRSTDRPRVYVTFYRQANSNGEINSSTGWGDGPKGSYRYYVMTYKGVRVPKKLKFI